MATKQQINIADILQPDPAGAASRSQFTAGANPLQELKSGSLNLLGGTGMLPNTLPPGTPLMNAADLQRGKPLRPTADMTGSSIPALGQDQLPDDINALKQQLGLAPAAPKPGILKSIGRGVLDIALQPARALEQVGKFIGTLGASPEQKKRIDAFYGPGIQERVAKFLGETDQHYATPTPESGKQAAGITLKAGANLAVPFGTSLPAMALQGAAYAGGDALEQGKSYSDAAFDATVGGVASAALGQLLNVGGAVVGRGLKAAAPEIAATFKPIADKLGPMFTGTTRKEFDTAFKQSPHVLLDYLNVVKDAGTPAEAEGILQARLLENVRNVVSRAKTAEGNAFSAASKTFNEAHPDVKVDVHAVARRLMDEMPRFGHPLNADETQALKAVQDIINQPREYTVDGTRTLLQDLYAVVDRLEDGTPAQRLAAKAWDDVRQELSKATSAVDDGVFDAAMARYSDFKDQTSQLKQLNSANEDTARSFVRNLTGANKTASREALEKLGVMAGVDDATSAIQMYGLMKKLSATGKITGSRVGDVALWSSAVAVPGTILGFLFGPGGAAVGHTLGTLLAAKALAPATITKVMLSEIEAAGIPITNEVRRALEEAIKNPAVRQSIINSTVNSLPKGQSNEKMPLP